MAGCEAAASGVGAGGAAVVLWIEPASTTVELQPAQPELTTLTGVELPQPQLGAGAGVEQPQLGAGAGAQQVGAGAQQVGAGAGAQQVGAGSQQVGAGVQHLSALRARSLANKPVRAGGQQAGAGSGQQVGAGAGAQQVGAGSQQLLALRALKPERKPLAWASKAEPPTNATNAALIKKRRYIVSLQTKRKWGT